MNPCKTGIPNAQRETIALVVLEIASFSICFMESPVTFIVRHAGNRTALAILASRASISYMVSDTQMVHLPEAVRGAAIAPSLARRLPASLAVLHSLRILVLSSQ